MRTTARMFSSNRFLLINSLVLILLFALLLSIEARKHSTDESNISELRHHRHRHRHEALGQRWPGTASRKRPFNDDNDYEENYTSDVDYEEYNYEDEGDQSEEDYATEKRNSRLYPPKRNNNNYHRYEPRYSAPRYYHRGAAHHVGTGRGHEGRGGGHDRVSHRRTSNSRSGYRKRYNGDGQDSSEEEADGYIDRPATSRRHYEDSSDDDSTSDILANEPDSYYYGKHKSNIPRKRIPAYSSSFSDVGESKGRRSRYEPRKDRRYKVDEEEDEYGYDADDEYEEDEVEYEDNERVNRSRKYAMRKAKVPKSERNRDEPILGRHSSSSGSSKFDEWFKRTQMMINNDSRSHDLAKKRNTRTHNDEDEQQNNEELTTDTDDENDEVELWKDDDEDKELDNDFYKNEDDSSTTPLKTFDDIIRRLTDDSASTTGIPTTQIKRDYRNTDHGSYLRPDAYSNLRMYELKRNASLANQSRYRSSTTPVSRNMNYVDFTSTTTGRKDTNKSNSAKKKSLEMYEAENNAKGEEDEGTQADANTDYAEDENEEDEGSATSLVTRSTTTTVTPTTPSTTTTTRATTTTTTTTQRTYPRYNERKDSRSYHDGAQYNGYQAKNDYPPMSAYSAHKWQTLGTRQGVKETRKNMAQYKSGQSAEGNAAHDHVMHVAKEGSCEWPRPKVIPVHDIYPNLTAIYDPHCAILHRCSDDTGCCRSETMTCVAKNTQRVEFYFYWYPSLNVKNNSSKEMIRAAVTVREFEQAVEMLKFTKKHFEDHLDQLIGLKRWAEKNYNTFKDNDLENEDFLRQLIRSKLNVLFDDVSKEEVKALNTYIRNFGSVKQFAKQKLIELSPHWCLYIYLEYACDEVVGPYSKMTFTKAQQICRVLFEDKENTEEQIFIDRSLRIRELTHDKSYINCEDAGEIEYSLRTIKLSKDFLKHHIDPCTPLPEKEDPITKKTSKLNSKQKKFMMDKLTADKVKFEIQRKRFREYVRKFNTDLLEHEADINEDPMVIADQLCKYYCITLQTIPILFWRLGHRSSLTQTSKNSTKASRRNLRQQFSPTKPKRFHDKFKTIKPPKKATYISKLVTEKLSFDNHTACECREKKEISDRPTDHRTARQMSYLMSSAPQNIVKPLARKPCRCTTQFTPRITVEGVCECSCVQDDHGCLKLRRGKGFISLTDRQCIQRGECTPPNCEYGEYVIAKGNCPKKKDMFEYYRGRPSYTYHPRRS